MLAVDRLNLILHCLLHPSQVWGHARQSFLGDSSSRWLNSDTITGEKNHNICGPTLECRCEDWVSSVADTYVMDSMSICTWDHDNQLIQASREWQKPCQRMKSRKGWTTVLARLYDIFLDLWMNQGEVDQPTGLGNIFLNPHAIKPMKSQSYQNRSSNTLRKLFPTLGPLRCY